jgi:hypothetical protein
MGDFIDDYINYTKESEPPTVYHRWCVLSAIGALLGRNNYIKFGPGKIYPNLYTMLIGDPGARKSISIKWIKKLLKESGYSSFAANKSSREKFLLDLADIGEEAIELNGSSKLDEGRRKKTYDRIMESNLWGENSFSGKEPKEVYIAADEFNIFTGPNNAAFFDTLGDLWDWDDETGPYSERVKNSISVSIYQPTVSLLGGNTPEGFATAFPPEIIGKGFFSRLILIYGERSDRRYHIMPTPDQQFTNYIIEQLRRIRGISFGEIEISSTAADILKPVYENFEDMDDIRFKSYSQRRYTQLLKLCIILSAISGNGKITPGIVQRSNTFLSAAEYNMPRALGEFGKGKNSDVVQKVLEIVERARKPQNIKEIWTQVYKDLGKLQELSDIMNSLMVANRVQFINAGPKSGFLSNRLGKKNDKFVNWSLLTGEEREYIGEMKWDI